MFCGFYSRGHLCKHCYRLVVHQFFHPVLWVGACCTVSQVILLGWSYPAPCQGDGLSGNWTSVLLFPGSFLQLFQGSEQKGLHPNVWPRVGKLKSALFTKPSRTKNLCFCMHCWEPQPPAVCTYGNFLRSSRSELRMSLPFMILKLQGASGSPCTWSSWIVSGHFSKALSQPLPLCELLPCYRSRFLIFFRLPKRRMILNWPSLRFMMIWSERCFLGSLTITCFLAPLLGHSPSPGSPFGSKACCIIGPWDCT